MDIVGDTHDTSETAMDDYDAHIWKKLNEHWERRSNRRGLPNWVVSAGERTSELASRVAASAIKVVPDVVKDPIRNVGEAVADQATKPAIHAATQVVELVNQWAIELNDPASVESLARKHGVDVDSFLELRNQHLRVCDRLLTRNTLTWRTAGALEGGAMGFLAMVPVAGIPIAISADILVIQVLSTSIATRVAYSYGFDAKDPAEQAFIERLVNRSFLAQAVKAKPLNDAARAAAAVKDRVRWSPKLRTDHPLLAGIENLMNHLGPAGGKVSVEAVAKVVPFVGVLIGAGVNAGILGNIATDAQRYCQTRFICEKYGMPLPAALDSDDKAAGDDE